MRVINYVSLKVNVLDNQAHRQTLQLVWTPAKALPHTEVGGLAQVIKNVLLSLDNPEGHEGQVSYKCKNVTL